MFPYDISGFLPSRVCIVGFKSYCSWINVINIKFALWIVLHIPTKCINSIFSNYAVVKYLCSVPVEFSPVKEMIKNPSNYSRNFIITPTLGLSYYFFPVAKFNGVNYVYYLSE